MTHYTPLNPAEYLPENVMTVADLIARLQALPQDTPIFWPGGGGLDVGPLTSMDLRVRQMSAVRWCWNDGETPDELDWYDDLPGDVQTIPALLLI